MSTELGGLPPWPFSIGRVLKDTFQVLRVNFLSCIVIAIADIVLWQMTSVFGDDVPTDGFSWWNFTIVTLSSSILWGLCTAILTYGVLLTLSGTRPSLRDLVRGVSFGVPVIAIYFISDLPRLCATMLGAMDPIGSQRLLPYIAIIIVGFVLNIYWFVSVPAVVAEGLGVVAALKRSAHLTAGHRWPIAGLCLLMGVAMWCLQWVLGIMGNGVNVAFEHAGPNLVFWIADFVLPALLLVFSAALQATAYCALRPAADGAGAQELARVFD